MKKTVKAWAIFYSDFPNSFPIEVFSDKVWAEAGIKSRETSMFKRPCTITYDDGKKGRRK